MKIYETHVGPIEIPSTSEDLTLKQFEDCLCIYAKQYEDEFEKAIDILFTVSSFTSKDDIENLDFRLAKELFNAVSFIQFELTHSSNKPSHSFEVDGKVFKTTKEPVEEYSFSTKEVKLIRQAVKNHTNSYLSYAIAILFKEVDAHGELVVDYSPEAIQERRDFIVEKVKMNIVAPWIETLGEYIIQ